jgi:hypothetical protein
VIDEHGRLESLATSAAHRPDCRFGSGFFRLTFDEHTDDHHLRYCQTWDEVLTVSRFLEGVVRHIRIERDGYCMDGDPMIGDANTPDVVDGDWWLSLPRQDAMRELGLTSDADYGRAYKAIEAAVGRRDNRASQGGVRASIVIKRPGARVTNVHV